MMRSRPTRLIPQYQQINRGMSLDEFKTIFWWEWSHRFLGRAIGAVFLVRSCSSCGAAGCLTG